MINELDYFVVRQEGKKGTFRLEFPDHEKKEGVKRFRCFESFIPRTMSISITHLEMNPMPYYDFADYVIGYHHPHDADYVFRFPEFSSDSLDVHSFVKIRRWCKENLTDYKIDTSELLKSKVNRVGKIPYILIKDETEAMGFKLRWEQ